VSTRRVPDDAFDKYVALGSCRSYQALADHLGVDKRTIVRRAAKEQWAERLAKIQQESRDAADKRIAETLSEMKDRHLKLLRAMGVRVANALREYPITSGMEAIRAADLVIKLERLIAGEASERTELSVEEVTRREINELLVRDDEPEAE
jgi:hypothetical protein